MTNSFIFAVEKQVSELTTNLQAFCLSSACDKIREGNGQHYPENLSSLKILQGKLKDLQTAVDGAIKTI